MNLKRLSEKTILPCQFLLSIFFSSLLFSQQVPQMNVVGKAELQASELIAKEIRDANGEICAGLIIATDLEGLKFDSYNGIVKMDVDKPGRYFLFLSPDERVVTVYKSGYEPLKLILSEYALSKMQSGKVWQIKITGAKKKTIYVIDSDPLGAKVEIDGRVRGETPVTDTLEYGEHLVVLRKESYQDISYKISCTEPRMAEKKTLLKKKGLLKFDTDPSNIRVTIDGRDMYTTPFQVALDIGQHAISIRDEKYEEVTRTIEITTEGTLQKVPLNSRKAAYDLETVPPDAPVRIDGVDAGKTPVHTLLNLGIHDVEIDLTNYDDLSYQIRMNDSGLREKKELYHYYVHEVGFGTGGCIVLEKNFFTDSLHRVSSTKGSIFVNVNYLYNLNAHLAFGIQMAGYFMTLNNFTYLKDGVTKNGAVDFGPFNFGLVARWTLYRGRVEPYCLASICFVQGDLNPSGDSNTIIASSTGFSFGGGAGLSASLSQHFAIFGEIRAAFGSASWDTQPQPYTSDLSFNPSFVAAHVTFSYRWGEH